jgi:hypothetical protein
MSESDKNQHNGNRDEVHADKRADILQAFCVHYYTMAMDHHTKAATTSNILLLVVGAIITVVGLDKRICGAVDFGGAIGLFLIGLFGVAWVWRQHELYVSWEYIAEEYQEELKKILPMFRTKRDYKYDAEKAVRTEFKIPYPRWFKDRYLWIFPHVLIALSGVFVLLAVVLKRNTCP